MHQLTQKLKDGTMEILEAPFPSFDDNQILVRNYYSVISAGTEGKTVIDARKGYISKAKSRKKELNQVINSIKTIGIKDTYTIVMNKLDAPSPLGYSCAGEVITIGKNVKNFKVGDRVACGGQGAYHAEVIAVYENLSIKLPTDVYYKDAAFSYNCFNCNTGDTASKPGIRRELPSNWTWISRTINYGNFKSWQELKLLELILIKIKYYQRRKMVSFLTIEIIIQSMI